MQTHFPATAWKYVTVVKGPGLDTKGSLISFINRPDVAADLLAVGMVGRKDPSQNQLLSAGTFDYALREAHMSSCVCKLHELPKESLFAIAVDGSDRAHLGVSLVEHLTRPTDRVRCRPRRGAFSNDSANAVLETPPGSRSLQDHSTQAFAPAHLKTAAIIDRYTKICAGKPHWSFELVHKPADKAVAGVLQDFTLGRVSASIETGKFFAARCPPRLLHRAFTTSLSALTEFQRMRMGETPHWEETQIPSSSTAAATSYACSRKAGTTTARPQDNWSSPEAKSSARLVPFGLRAQG